MAIALQPGQDPDGSDWRYRFARRCLKAELWIIEAALNWTNRRGWHKAPWRSWLIRIRRDRIKRWHRGLL